MKFVFSGALAGALSTLVFTLIHDLLISNIWSMLGIMLVAGVICGAVIAGSYAYLVTRPSWRGWLGYNLLYLIMFFLLGLASVLLFEPVMSMAALVSADAPPDDLIVQALPFTAIFTLIMAIALAQIYGWTWRRFAAILGTCAVLVILLGLNVSVIGLVAIPRGSLYLVAEMFALIVVLNVVYVAVFIAMERKSLGLNVPGRVAKALSSLVFLFIA